MAQARMVSRLWRLSAEAGSSSRRPSRRSHRPALALFSFAVVALGASADSAENSAAPSAAAPATRIVSLAPSLTESLVFIGAQGKLVGRTRFCVWPRGEVDAIPTVGGMADPSLETLLALHPDLVVATEMTPRNVSQRLESLGLRVAILREHGIPGIFDDLNELARLTGIDADARIEALRKRLADVRDVMSHIPPDKRPGVVVLYGIEGLHSTAEGTFPSGIIEAAGGRNLVTATSSPWPTLNMEQLVVLDPEVILVTADHLDDEASVRASIEELPRRPLWNSLRAVKSKRVVLLGDSLLSIPGPRTIEAIERVARVLHPELFGKSDRADSL